MELQLSNLTCQYNATSSPAVNQLNLRFNTGITGLLGPNGAGKSSLMQMLACLNKPTKGNIFFNGEDVYKQKKDYLAVLGFLPQYFGVYENLSATEFLLYLASLKGMSSTVAKTQVAELLDVLNLSAKANDRLHTYSGGMRQRVGIAQALLNQPKVLIFDEPTVGLDPNERAAFRDLLVDYSERCIVLLSTHIVSDIESIASDLCLMQHGNVVAAGEGDSLVNALAGKVWQCEVDKQHANTFKQQFTVSHSIRKQSKMQFRVVANESALANFTPTAVTPNLEDAYVYYTQHHAGNIENLIGGK